jgi:two-component system, OmpR family, phosphate regulon sensor histidine kinase PhoR
MPINILPEWWTISIVLTQKEIQISDSGIGIASKHISKIWDKFRKVDASRKDTKSFGLGLSLVKMLVERHGWTVSVKSEHNKGTTFILTFDHAHSARRR